MTAKSKTHKLKIIPKYFQPVLDGRKTFEIRKNDRDYQAGDLVELHEYQSIGYSGRFVKAQILFVSDYEQKENYVVFAIKVFEISNMNFGGK